MSFFNVVLIFHNFFIPSCLAFIPQYIRSITSKFTEYITTGLKSIRALNKLVTIAFGLN